MASITVSNASQLMAALSNANGGDTILLNSGNYGSLSLNNMNFSSDVTIKSANGDMGAVFNNISFSNSSHIIIDNVEIYNSSQIASNSAFGVVSLSNGSHHIEISNSEIHSYTPGNPQGGRGIYGYGVDDLTFENNYIHNVSDGAVFIGVDGLNISGNTFNDLRSDAMQFSGIHDAVIADNTGPTHYYPQSDDHADFIQFTGANSSDIVISGNVSLLSTVPYVQGIFLADATFTNVLIENNIISTGMANGILVSAGSGNIARNNTVIHLDGTASSSSYVGGSVNSYDNIYVNWMESSSNEVIDLAYNYSDYFQGIPDGGKLGLTIEDFKPVAGSPAEDVGAYARVAELLGDGSYEPPVDVNHAPDAVNDSLALDEDSSATVNVLNNDSDSDGDTLTVQGHTQAAHGDVVNNGDGTFTYTPDANFFGTDSFSYTVSDGEATDTATVNITVKDVAEPPVTAPGGDITVSNASQLMAALNSAAGGETILLSSGNYGSLNLNGIHFSSDVTIKSADGNMGAKFSGIDIDNSSHIRIDNVEVYSSTAQSLNSANALVSVDTGSHHITFSNSEVHSFVSGTPLGGRGLYAGGNSHHVTFENNFVHDIGKGGVFIGTDDLTLFGNTFETLRNDTFQLGSVENVLIENNIGARNYYGQSGDHQDFIQFTGQADNVVIRGNVSLLESDGSIQGIFLDDAVFNNVLIENNIISTSMGRGISISEGTGNVARNNTLIHIDAEGGSKGTFISGVDTYYDNIYVNWVENSKNLVIDFDYEYSNYFQGVPDGGKLGLTIEDLQPVAGSAAENMGAYTRVAELLGEEPPVVDVNHTPDAVNDSLTLDEDSSATVNVLNNDSDSDGDTLTVQGHTQAAHGDVVNNGDGTFTYTPDANFFGSDSFSYTVSDGELTDTATVNITVNDVAEPVDGIVVSNASQLWAALSSATGGETIILKDGSYGTLNTTKDFSDFVTIKAENTLGATFENIYVNGGSNFHFDGVKVNKDADFVDGVDHITVTNSYFNNGLYFRNGSNIVVDSNEIANSANGLILNDIKHFEVTNNYIHDARSDILRVTGDSFDGLIENNTLSETHPDSPDHPDLIQMFGSNGNTPHDIVIRGNLLYDDVSTGAKGAQGIFISDPGSSGGYKNILIEDNLIHATLTNVIYINGGQENVVVQNNTLLGSNALIRLDDKSGLDNSGTIIRNNVAEKMLDETNSSQIYNNYLYGSTNQNTLFTNPGDGSNWEDYIPVEGSPIDFGSGYGALARLAELMGNPPVDVNDRPDAVNDSLALDQDTSATVNVLGNDSDRDGDTLTVDGFTQGAHGTVVNNGNGSFTYTPNAGYDGADSFTYTITDGELKDTATVNVTVKDTDAPTEPTNPDIVFSEGAHSFNGATSSAVILPHNADYVLANGTLEMVFKADTTAPAMQGLFTKDATGYGQGGHMGIFLVGDDLRIRMQNSNSESDFTIANVVNAGTEHHLAVTFGATGIDVYLDGARVGGNDSWTHGLQGNKEPIVIGANQWASTAEAANNLRDAFDGTISKVNLYNSALSAADIDELVHPNAAPVANNDTLTLDEDTSATVNALANDSDADGDSLSISGFTQGAHGTVVNNDNGTFTYTPDADFFGSDSFTYTVSDGELTAQATVNITVNDVPEPNVAPNAVNDQLTLDEDTAATVNVLANDADANGDSLTIQGHTQAAHGTVVNNGDGTFTYTPNADFFGSDSFTYTVSDGEDTDTATVAITVNDVAEPVEPAELEIVFSEGAHSFNGATSSAVILPHNADYVLANGTLEMVFKADTTAPAMQGLFTKDATGYGQGGHMGIFLVGDDLRIRMQNSNSESDFTIANVVNAGTEHHLAVTFGATGIDVYLDGARVGGNDSWTHGLQGNKEPIVIGANQWASTAEAANNLRDAFDGTISKVNLYNQALTEEDVESLANPNEAPVSNNDAMTLDEDTSATVNVLANDTDADGDSLSVSGFTQAEHGAVINNGDGTFTYTPDADYFGSDSFTYTVSDGEVTDTATVAITVNDVAEPVEEPTPLIPEAIFEEGAHTFNGATSSAVILPHEDAYQIANGTLEMTFNADTTAKALQGLLTKDATGYGNGGHMGVFLAGDDLRIRMQNGTTQSDFTIANKITAGTEYHLALTFGETGIDVYLDGVRVGGDDGWTHGLQGNKEPIVIGANQWASAAETANALQDAFDGTISEVKLYGEAFDAEDVAILAHGETLGYLYKGSVEMDVMMGSEGNDLIRGSGGNDTLIGDGGRDTLQGGNGDDTLIARAIDDKVVVRGHNGDDTALIHSNNSNARLGDGNDTYQLFNTASNDGIDSGKGHHVVFGEEGTDSFIFTYEHIYKDGAVVTDTDQTNTLVIRDFEKGETLEIRLQNTGAVAGNADSVMDFISLDNMIHYKELQAVIKPFEDRNDIIALRGDFQDLDITYQDHGAYESILIS